jgi:arginyl-tRNA synthetase
LKYREFEEEVRGHVRLAIHELGMPDADIGVTPPSNPAYGDLSCPVALQLGVKLGRKPGEVALLISERIMNHGGDYRYVKGVSAHPNGYLNFTLDYGRFVFDSLTEVGSTEKIGAVDVGSSRTVAIEHTNVNPNKALHVGHARNLVLGDALVRIMRHAGYDVQALNYIDDSGAQVADIVVGFRFLGLKDEPPEGSKFDSYCGDSVYVKVNQEYARDPSLREKQSLVLREIEKGDGEIAAYTRRIVKRILDDQLKTCWRLGASYDLLNWESQIFHSGIWAELFARMKDKGLAKMETAGENQGCWVTFDPDTGEEKVLVRSDGTAVYVAKDIPYAAWKIGLVRDPFAYEVYTEKQPTGARLWTTTTGDGVIDHPGFGSVEMAVSVIDTKQSYLQRIVGKVLDGLEPGSARKYIHRGYEVVALSKKTASTLGVEMDGEFVHMSGRKGLYINVDATLDALKVKAVEETRRRNPSESEAWVVDVSEAVAVAALRYELVRQDSDKMIVFDMDSALRFEGDTGPYLLYTYARARRILERSQATPKVTEGGAGKLVRRPEKELVLKLSMLDKAVLTATEYLAPKELAVYSHELAVAFNLFYERVPVNREEDSELREARLALVDAASRVLAQSMQLLGIPQRERI